MSLQQRIDTCVSHLKDIENDLRRLQAATDVLGFDQLSEELHEASVGIACQCVQLRKAAADDLDASFQKAKENVGSIFHAALSDVESDKKS